MPIPLKKLPGYVGYLIGSFFITVIWFIEKMISFFKNSTSTIRKKLDDGKTLGMKLIQSLRKQQ